MLWSSKSSSRRAEIRKNRPDTIQHSLIRWQQNGALQSIGIATAFCVLVIAILMMREEVVPYRPGQWVPYDIVARVDFTFNDRNKLADQQRLAREQEPRIYKANHDAWSVLQEKLLDLPNKASIDNPALNPEPLKSLLDAGAVTAFRQENTPERRPSYDDAVISMVKDLQKMKVETRQLIVLPIDQWREEIAKDSFIRIDPDGVLKASKTFSTNLEELKVRIEEKVRLNFRATYIQPRLVEIILAYLQLHPTHVLDETATAEAQNNAYNRVPSTAGHVTYKANQVLVDRKLNPTFDTADWLLLRAENDAYRRSLGNDAEKLTIGLAITAVLLTITLAGYIGSFQRRLLKNHTRSIAIGLLLLSMLLLAQLAAITSVPPYLLDIASTVLVAMILAIAYDKRFALGVGTAYALLVTVALDQTIGYFIIQWVGVMTSTFLLGDVRTRSKLIEVGGAAAIAMMVATLAHGLTRLEPLSYIGTNCLYVGAAGLAAGFITLGILPFIEKAFRITTSMTLLEIADASQPLLRRLALEAPGTYNHSLQVATLAESAAEAIGSNSLLCRVASYYHDVGKMNKADYFVENQGTGENRHLNLSPSVSLLIIKGHVKDGIELAKEYNLPTSLHAFIQQHHGTTLVEFFYHRACKAEQGEDCGVVSEEQYRYDGPKPRSKEVAIVMLADCVESACRAMPEPTASRVESLVHDLALKRLLDGQFDECDLTIRDVEMVERAMVKTLLGIYHGRIAYPSTSNIQTPSAIRSA